MRQGHGVKLCRHDVNTTLTTGSIPPTHRNGELSDCDSGRDGLVNGQLLDALDADTCVNLREVVANGITTLKLTWSAGRREREFKDDICRSLIQQFVELAVPERGHEPFKTSAVVGMVWVICK